MIYQIVYDPFDPRFYNFEYVLSEGKYGEARRIYRNVWWLKTDSTARELREELVKHFDEDMPFLITEIGDQVDGHLFTSNILWWKANKGEKTPWINAETKQPERGEYVLCYDPDASSESTAIFICDYDPDEDRWYDMNGYLAYPSYWMPIPKIPNQ